MSTITTRPADDERECRQALAKHPGDPKISLRLGILLGMQRRFAESCEVLERAIDVHGNIAELHLNLGVSRQNMGLLTEAAIAFDNALSINPRYPEALLNRGAIHQTVGEFDTALALYDRLIDIRPNYAGAHHNRAQCLLRAARLVDALDAVGRAIDLAPGDPNFLNTRATVSQTIGRFDDAIADYTRAIAIAPNADILYANRANCAVQLARFDDAVSDYRRASALAPHRPEWHRDLGVCLGRTQHFAESLAEFQTAAQLAPNDPDLQFRVGLAELLLGDFRNGWQHYEARLHLGQFATACAPDRRWDGNVRPGQTLLVRAEQGYGDTIQFIRLLPILKQTGLRIIFECQPGLKPLLADCAGFDEIVEWNPNAPAYDMPQVPLLSLPSLIGIDLDTIPWSGPYITVDAAATRQWATRIDELHSQTVDLTIATSRSPIPMGEGRRNRGEGIRVGICWAGRPTHENDHYRSATFADFARLADIDGIQLFSLQMGDAATQLGPGVVDLGREIDTFVDTAAIIDNLDLIITVDTSIAHLAGALGKPVWNLLAAQPDWRWLTDRHDSPWYPTMRLFRQHKIGDWTPVLDSVAVELAAFAKAPVAA